MMEGLRILTRNLKTVHGLGTRLGPAVLLVATACATPVERLSEAGKADSERGRELLQEGNGAGPWLYEASPETVDMQTADGQHRLRFQAECETPTVCSLHLSYTDDAVEVVHVELGAAAPQATAEEVPRVWPEAVRSLLRRAREELPETPLRSVEDLLLAGFPNPLQPADPEDAEVFAQTMSDLRDDIRRGNGGLCPAARALFPAAWLVDSARSLAPEVDQPVDSHYSRTTARFLADSDAPWLGLWDVCLPH